jgi:hypothetical protein
LGIDLMVAFKILLAGIFAAGAVSLAIAPVAQADPPTPGRTQFLTNDPGDTPCADNGCQQPGPTKSIYPRHVYACIRGACVPLPYPTEPSR